VSVQLTETNQKHCQQGLLEIDHICLCLPELPSVSQLQELGVVCNESTLSYPDRGTVSRVIFFSQMYLEFVAVVDSAMANQFALRTGLDFAARAQWQRSRASPFGIALRHRLDVKKFVRSRRFSRQVGATLPQLDGLTLSFSTDNLTDQTDPFCFVVPEALSLPALINSDMESYRRRVSHPLGMEELTHAVLKMSYTEPQSPPMRLLAETQILTLVSGSSPLLELTFDGYQQSKQLDLRALDMPLVLKF